jgi:hypothetical protein
MFLGDLDTRTDPTTFPDHIFYKFSQYKQGSTPVVPHEIFLAFPEKLLHAGLVFNRVDKNNPTLTNRLEH